MELSPSERASTSGWDDDPDTVLGEVEELVGLGTWSWVPGSPTVRLSAMGHRMLGVPVGRPVTFADLVAAVVPADRPLVDATVRAALRSCEPFAVELRLGDPGSPRIIDLRARPVRDDAGRTRLRGTAHDITAVRRSAQEASEAHQHLQALLDHAPAAITLRDLDGRYLTFNESGAALSAETPDAFIGTTAEDHFPTEVAATVAAEEAVVLRTGEARSFEVPATTGVDRTMLVTKFPVRDATGAITAVGGISIDVSERRRAEERLRQVASQFRTVFDEAPIGMALLSRDGRITRVNEALVELTGHRADVLKALDRFELVAPVDRRTVAHAFEALESSRSRASVEHRIVHASGQIRWVSTCATLIETQEGTEVQILAHIQDVTEQRATEERLRRMAIRDPLTGLLNRRGLEASLMAHLARCRRYGFAGALLILDLDGFKVVNDSLGHAYGDRLITRVAEALKERLRATDTIARLGGDEFAILLPAEDETAAREAAQALIETVRLKANHQHDGHPGTITASVGVAIFDDPRLDADTMLVNADLAMYEAKQDGKNRCVVYSRLSENVPRVKSELEWLARIETALDSDDFTLYAQPIFDLRTGAVLRHEVLVRMLSPTGELIAPGRFLEVAERFGMMPRLDAWILSRAIRVMATAKAWGTPLPLSVNVSSAAIGDPQILELIERELGAGQIPPENLTIEITESAALADLARVRAFAESLSALGCRVALDDFGAGLAAFQQLKHLPFDLVKIDGEFVRQSADSRVDRLVVRAITELATQLGKDVVAEQVVDAPLVDLLLGLGVTTAQGFHLGRPRPLREVLGDGLAADLVPA